MLVRRIATVTISAPLASTAALVSAKSLYLPVPMRRRELYDLPPITSGSRFSCGFIRAGYRIRLSAADGDHDLQAVPVGDTLLGVAAAGHDLAVALERDALARELQPLDQLRAIERRLEPAGLAVDGDQDHACHSQ